MKPPGVFSSAILAAETEKNRKSPDNVSLHGPSSHRRNTSRLTSPSGTVAVSEVAAVAEAAVAIGAVHQGKSATSVPVSSVLEGLQPRVADSVAPHQLL